MKQDGASRIVGTTQNITKAMEMVAAAKLERAQDRASYEKIAGTSEPR